MHVSVLDRYESQLFRFLYFGVPLRDLVALQNAKDWGQWGSGLAARAAEYEARADRAAERGHINSAISLWETAASCFHYAQLKWPYSEEKQRLQACARRVFVNLGPHLDPPAEQISIPFDCHHLPGYVRLTAHAPIVLMLNGLDSCKEVELSAFAAGFVERGLSVACVDLPGLGEMCGLASLHEFDTGLRTVVEWLSEHGCADHGLGVFGVSFGGHLACRAAAQTPEIAAGVCLGGFFNFAPMLRLPTTAAANLRRAYRLDAEEPIENLRNAIDLRRLRPPLETALLIVHGTRDHLVDINQVEQIHDWAPQSELLVFGDSEHVCTDRFAECLPTMWDFMADRLKRPGSIAAAPRRRHVQ
jgi:2,6-dihydroxypseudooxynicotine hydrolase